MTVVRIWPDDHVHIIFCDVGQGDAILISYHFTQVLIDAGKDNTVLHCLSQNMAFWDDTIEYVIATHPDADHIGGFESVLAVYSVGAVITNGDFKNTADFEAFIAAVSRNKGEVYRPFVMTQGDTITISRLLSFTALSPRVGVREKREEQPSLSEIQLWDKNTRENLSIKDSNNRSIALFMSFNGVSALFMGDLEEDAELALVAHGVITQADILKVGHHGAKTSTTESLLSRVRPEISVLSVGKNNNYNHPTPEVIERLEQFGSMIYRTDTQGTIHFVTDGNYIWLF